MNQVINDFLALPIIKDITSKKKFVDCVKEKRAVYCGFDPSASDLHLGNYIQINMLNRLVALGLEPIIVLGSATGFIGDPSGKNKERQLLSKEQVQHNALQITKTLEKLVPTVKIVNNYDWLHQFSYLNFLRDCGKFFNIASLVQRDQVQTRLQTGLSYTEFSYVLLQSYDFYHLYKHHNCYMQIGGSDQWGNIVFGIEFIRRKMQTSHEDNAACGVTFKLLTTRDGKKFGKSENNALFLNPSLTLPYEIYQYLLNSDDNDIENLFYYLTLLSQQEIINLLQSTSKSQWSFHLANEVMKILYGEKTLQTCQTISKLLFTKDLLALPLSKWNHVLNDIPIFLIKSNALVSDSLASNSHVTSKSEFYRLIKSNGIKVNGKLCSSSDTFANFDLLWDKYLVIQIGKRKRFLYALS